MKLLHNIWFAVGLLHVCSDSVSAETIDIFEELQDFRKRHLNLIRPDSSKPFLYLEASNKTFVENVPVKFTCMASLNGKSKLNWYVDSKIQKKVIARDMFCDIPLSPYFKPSLPCVINSIFIFKPYYTQNSTNITCAISSGVQSLRSEFISNRTLYKPRQLTCNNTKYVQRGKHLYLSCEFDVNSPANITWFFNGTILQKNDTDINISVSMKNNKFQSSLYISEAFEWNSGLYKCVLATSDFMNQFQYPVEVNNYSALALNNNCTENIECKNKDENSYCSSVCLCVYGYEEENHLCKKKDEEDSDTATDMIVKAALTFFVTIVVIGLVVTLANLIRRCVIAKKHRQMGLRSELEHSSITMLALPSYSSENIPDIPYFTITSTTSESELDLSPPKYEDVVKESEPPPKYSVDMKPKGQKFSLIVSPRERFRSIVRHVAILLNVGETSRVRSSQHPSETVDSTQSTSTPAPK